VKAIVQGMDRVLVSRKLGDRFNFW